MPVDGWKVSTKYDEFTGSLYHRIVSCGKEILMQAYKRTMATEIYFW